MTAAFVAGATGYTGREVVRVLREQGVETWAHVRPDSRQLSTWRERFGAFGAEVDQTPWEPGALTARLASLRPDLVYALLGTTRARAEAERARSGGDAGYEAIDYGLTVMLYRAAVDAGIRPRFIYLSSIGAREDGNAYLAARGRVERVLREGPLPWISARPSFITGADRDEFRPGERIGAAVGDAMLALAGLLGAGRLRDRYRSTSNAVLGAALVRLGLDPTVANRVVESELLR